jgi:ATP-dependent Zn protease
MASIHKRKPTKEERCTAYHEAGHAVAAFYLHRKIRSVTICSDEGYSGNVRVRGRRRIEGTFDDSTDKVFNDILILYAGQLAQNRFAPRSLRRWHVQTGHSSLLDHDQIVDLALTQTDEAGVPLLLKFLKHQAENLVECRWDDIRAVAEALLKRKTLSGDEVRKIIVPLPPECRRWLRFRFRGATII